jgi:hypothetical protein
VTWSDVAVAGAFALGIVVGGAAALHLARTILRIRDKESDHDH